jgi:hypothetical protein
MKNISSVIKTEILPNAKTNIESVKNFDYNIITTNIEYKKYNEGKSKNMLSTYISEQFRQSDAKKASYLNIITALNKNITDLQDNQDKVVALFGNNQGSPDKFINNILNGLKENMPQGNKNALKANSNIVPIVSTIKNLKAEIIKVTTSSLNVLNKNKNSFTTAFKKYLLDLKTAIYNKIQDYYNKVSDQKLAIVTEEIAKFNAQPTSKNILAIINTPIINELLELLGWSKTINDVLQENKVYNIYNGINGNKNLLSIGTLADTISTSIKSKYLTDSKQKVNNFKGIYSAKVTSEIDTLVNTVTDLKTQLLALVEQVTSSKNLASDSLGNKYVINGIPVLDNVTSTIGQIMPVKENIMNKLAEIISEIQTRLEIPDVPGEGVTVPGSVVRNVEQTNSSNVNNKNEASSVDLDPNEALSMSRKSPQKPSLNKPVLQNKIKEILSRNRNTAKKIRELSATNKAQSGWQNGISDVISSHPNPNGPNYNNSRYLKSIVNKQGFNPTNIKKIVKENLYV